MTSWARSRCLSIGVVVGRSVDHAGDISPHVGDFFGAFVDQQQDQVRVGIVGGDAAGNVLEEDRLAGARRGDDQAAWPKPTGARMSMMRVVSSAGLCSRRNAGAGSSAVASYRLTLLV